VKEVASVGVLSSFIKSEFFIWIVFASLFSSRFIIAMIGSTPEFVPQIIERYYFDVLVGVLIIIFPLLFLQVFGSTPIEAFRTRKSKVKNDDLSISGDNNIINLTQNIQSEDSVNGDIIEASIYLRFLAKDAESLSGKIYNRSGVYLLFGVLIAFSGIFYFSFQPIALPEGAKIEEVVLLLAPRFGILFFIEFIAFFFLKQYRSAMDEFRHYEGLKRARESQLAILLMASNNFEEKDFSTIIDKMSFFERFGVLSKGETTELIESNKLNDSELSTLKVLAQDVLKTKVAK